MRTPCCVLSVSALLISALAVGNPFLPKAPDRAAPATGVFGDGVRPASPAASDWSRWSAVVVARSPKPVWLDRRAAQPTPSLLAKKAMTPPPAPDRGRAVPPLVQPASFSAPPDGPSAALQQR